MCKKKRSSHHFLEQPEVDSEDCIFNLPILDDSGNVQPTYLKLLVENISINLEADTGFAHSAISEKLYLRHFKDKTLYPNVLTLKDYVGGESHFQIVGICKFSGYF